MFWRIPRPLIAAFLGVLLAGVSLAVIVPALGYLPGWLPWTLIVSFLTLCYFVMRRLERKI